jgi:hypothetical protein
VQGRYDPATLPDLLEDPASDTPRTDRFLLVSSGTPASVPSPTPPGSVPSTLSSVTFQVPFATSTSMTGISPSSIGKQIQMPPPFPSQQLMFPPPPRPFPPGSQGLPRLKDPADDPPWINKYPHHRCTERRLPGAFPKVLRAKPMIRRPTGSPRLLLHSHPQRPCSQLTCQRPLRRQGTFLSRPFCQWTLHPRRPFRRWTLQPRLQSEHSHRAPRLQTLHLRPHGHQIPNLEILLRRRRP